MRTQDELMAQAKEVEMAANDAASRRLSQEYGIKGTPILSTISSVSFPTSFPFDFMHLIWENLIPNLILFWTGSFKELDHRDQDYVISAGDWAAIGKATAESRSTIPSAFGAPPPNIATQRSQMTSEMYCNWTLFIATVVLRGKFRNSAYDKHFMNLVELLMSCLALEIDEQELEEIERGFQTWVEEYESEDTRNASYIKYVQTVNRFARQQNRPPEFVPRVYFGQLKRLLILEVPPIPELSQDTPSKIIFAVVQGVKTFQENNIYYYTDLGPIEIIDLNTIECVVGRV
ncbi:hypothetical protein AGABI2DRAFT_122508 [Agaricus bisporus var. bisporus H97]|uniref:hypothetical protein n=1 Tax=Agaricus bisporus var. bisporus (strain H97 / ATCC MYA-4626 / FGSC 10389) TaxID=936046 RepID=UPI00029F5D95|nr:hypothetical protein AGABI2DRAFT_122508 [Agaricus bisporus var. bisporus H97]EKV42939.1 hypothetical protein AGABI2DRAFT_122508 [Agaricus bisporus var. bisporus H97]